MQLMHSRWPTFGALVAGISAVAAIWYVVLGDPAGEAVPATGGRYVEGVRLAPERINPLYAYANKTDRDISSLVFSGLVRLAPDGTPLPDLAERWEITDSGATYVFHLRRGVAWHDAPDSRFDAEDVVATFRAIADPEFRGDPALAQLMEGVVVTARDARTVEFKLEEAYAPFLAYLTVGILPEHLLGDLDADGLYNAAFNAQPTGTGPYRVKGRSREGVVLEANTTYHFGPPHISTIEFRIVADEGGLVASLRSGDIDGALFGPDAEAAELKLLRDDSRFTLQELTGTSSNMVYFDTRSALFNDVAVRGALVQAVNPQSLIDSAAAGRGEPTDTGIPVASWAHADVAGLGFSPGAAARALEIAGWSRGRDGVRRKGDLRLSFGLSTSNDSARAAIAEDVARQWRAVGAEVVVYRLDAATYIQQFLLPRAFQTALVEIDPGPDPDPYPFWHSSQVADPGRNLAGFSSSQLDDVLQRARQNTDMARRKDLYEDFATFLIAGSPAVPLYAPVSTYVQRNDVRGFDASLLFSPASRFSNAYEWYIKTRVR